MVGKRNVLDKCDVKTEKDGNGNTSGKTGDYLRTRYNSRNAVFSPTLYTIFDEGQR
jgi:hypothetical protein